MSNLPSYIMIIGMVFILIYYTRFLIFQEKKKDVEGSMSYRASEEIKRGNYTSLLKELKEYFSKKGEKRIIKKLDKVIKEPQKKKIHQLLKEIEVDFFGRG
ncbi:MAG: hypothetical protein QXX95_06225 [Nitrososphaerales archaeon]